MPISGIYFDKIGIKMPKVRLLKCQKEEFKMKKIAFNFYEMDPSLKDISLFRHEYAGSKRQMQSAEFYLLNITPADI